MPKRVLVTGWTGFVGDALIRDTVTLSEHDRTCVFHSNRDVEYVLLPRWELDLMDYQKTEDAVSNYSPDVILHLAAKCGGLFDNINHPAEFWYKNTVMSVNILQAAAVVGIKHFIGCLSSCIYPDKVGEGYYPMQTTDIFRGAVSQANLGYGFGKRALLEGMMSYSKEFPDIKFHGLIPCNMCGPGDRSTHFIPSFVKRLKAGEKSFLLNGTGMELRQFMNVEDFVAILLKYIDKLDTFTNPLNVFNVAPDKPQYTIRDMAYALAAPFGVTDIRFNGERNSQYRKDIDGTEILKIIPHEFDTFEEIVKLCSR